MFDGVGSGWSDVSALFFRWGFAALHLLALPIGFAAVASRAVALRQDPGGRSLRMVLTADNVWAVAALLWIATGLVRAFTGLEKGSAYYLGNGWFWLKMGILILIVALEVRPMITLMRWRIASRRGTPINIGPARILSRISVVQACLVIAMVLAATAMARGFGV